MDFAEWSKHMMKGKEGEKKKKKTPKNRGKFLDFASELKNVENASDSDTNRSWSPRNSL